MEKRMLGNSGLEVSRIGLGCMNMSNNFEDIKSRKEMERIIQKAFDMGVTYFDTAEVYGPFNNETLVGEAVKSFRKNIVLGTKCGIKAVDGKQVVDGNIEGIKKSVEGSLKRLQTDYIDLYFLHRVDPKVSIEEVAETMKELKKEGKILHWGISEPGVNTIRKAHDIFPLTAIESEYSMMYREPEKEVIPTLEELGIGFIPFSPLAKGFLTGASDATFTSPNQANTRFSDENIRHNKELLDIVNRFATEKSVTPAQISLAWVAAQKSWIVPIPGTTKMHRLEENVRAGEIEITKTEIKEINTVLDKFEVAGDRYAPGSDYAKRVGI